MAAMAALKTEEHVRLPAISTLSGVLVVALVAAGCGDGQAKPTGPSQAAKPAPPPERKLRVFHAAGLTALLDAVRADCQKELGIVLETEGSGSQMACRKITEMKRHCDLVMLADSFLVAELLRGACSWRMDFGTDEIVLGVGKRAPNAELAEKDWPAALLADGIRFARTDENLAPIGYRTLMTWKLQELQGTAGLYDKLMTKCGKVVDDVGRLTPLLANGELDYAFVYRSSCIGHSIRFIRLDDAVNLGSPERDYFKATVTFQKLKTGQREDVTMKGGPIVWTLSIPERDADAETAAEFVRWLLAKKGEALKSNGLRPIQPACFYGPADKAAPFKDVAKLAGELK
jgi:molybdate/tungstate transport system substrate-binding protein